MSKQFESMEDALEAQKAKAIQVKEAKAAHNNYFKENKLKKTEDYSEDKKHGKKVTRLESKVDKYSDELTDINEAIKKMKPGKTKSSEPKKLKYDYPDDVVTADQKKKYRIQQRKAAKAGEEPAEGKPKSIKKKGKTKVEEEGVEEAPKKSKKKKTKEVEEEPASKGKSKSRKRKEEDVVEDDD